MAKAKEHIVSVEEQKAQEVHAMSAPHDKGALVGAEPELVQSQDVAVVNDEPEDGEKEGVRTRRAFMLKQFIPSQDWVNKHIVAGGKGTRATLGRVYGVAFSTADKMTTLPDGTPNKSIVVSGAFNTVNYLTGELGQATIAYFPMAYAEKIAGIFKMDPEIKVVEVDCDIGLEATGKTIPYEWVVVAFREGDEMATMKKIRNSRKRPTDLLLTAKGEPLKLTAG